MRFYNFYDEHKHDMSERAIAAHLNIHWKTCQKWRRQRDVLGSPAHRPTRKLSKRLGRPQKEPPKRIKMLVDPKQNPVREQTIPAQLKFHNINLGARQVSRRLKQDTKGGRKFRMTYTNKEVSVVNMKKRVDYGHEHGDKSIEDFWAYILFTDETHFDPASQRQGWVLREEGTRYDPANIQKRPQKKGVEVHAAAWVTWDAKADKLEFFNDEHHNIIRPKKPRKPRHRKKESTEQWEERLKAYEAEMARQTRARTKTKGQFYDPGVLHRTSLTSLY